MIVVTWDHGDYVGDHSLGEKDFFPDASVKIPLIVYDPRASADATRGTTCDALVEAIDLVPTFLEATGAPPADQPDPGPVLCSCFSVGVNTILTAIETEGLMSVEAIGAALGAGTNCGSCRPELAELLARCATPEAAE